jgi:hypothetical protein
MNPYPLFRTDHVECILEILGRATRINRRRKSLEYAMRYSKNRLLLFSYCGCQIHFVHQALARVNKASLQWAYTKVQNMFRILHILHIVHIFFCFRDGW